MGLIDFVAFLVQTLWQNNRILIGEIPQVSVHILFFSVLTFEPETLESRSRVLKTHIIT